jgi:hypothetical protein
LCTSSQHTRSRSSSWGICSSSSRPTFHHQDRHTAPTLLCAPSHSTKRACTRYDISWAIVHPWWNTGMSTWHSVTLLFGRQRMPPAGYGFECLTASLLMGCPASCKASTSAARVSTASSTPHSRAQCSCTGEHGRRQHSVAQLSEVINTV